MIDKYGYNQNDLITAYRLLDAYLQTNRTQPESSGLVTVYHNTSSQTLFKILEKGNLRAGHRRYMNDPGEYVFGLGRLIDLYKRKVRSSALPPSSKKWYNSFFDMFSEKASYHLDVLGKDTMFAEIYSISFCKTPDLLPSWQIYSKESGVQLEFGFNASENYQIQYNDGSDGPLINNYLYNIIYDIGTNKALQNDWFRQFTQNFKIPCISPEDALKWYAFSNRYNLGNLFSLASFIKDKGYKHEEESRLIFYPFYDGGKAVKVDFQPSDNVLKPFMDIKCQGGWPIKAVLVGPGSNQDAVFESVIHMFEVSGLCQYIRKPDKAESYKKFLEYAKRFIFGTADLKAAPEERFYKHFLSQTKRHKLPGCSKIAFSRMLLDFKDYTEDSLNTDKLQRLEHFGPLYQQFLSKNHITSSGIIIRKSELKYNFSTR